MAIRSFSPADEPPTFYPQPRPMKSEFSRRKFLRQSAGAGLGLGLSHALARAAEPTPAASAAAKPAVAPTAWPVSDELDESALREVLRSGKWGRGNGRMVAEFEKAFAGRSGAAHCIATSCGTTALQTVLGALDIGPGDEVVMPPYTFVATFNAITANFALPVFADVDPRTFQIDAGKVAAALTADTRVLMPVHLGGAVADMDAINALARGRRLTVIEDACQAPLAEWRGRAVGTHGLAGCFSFQASKNLTSGEGGAVLTNDADLAARCLSFHDQGKIPTAPMPGRGSNYRLTEFQGALLLAQLTRFERQSKTRAENAAYLSQQLREIGGLAPVELHEGCTRSAWHLYMFRYEAARFAGLTRAKFVRALAKEGVPCSTGYTPLNATPHVQALATNRHYWKIYGEKTMKDWVARSQCPANDRLCGEAVWFTQNLLLGPRSDMDRLADVMRKIQRTAPELARA